MRAVVGMRQILPCRRRAAVSARGTVAPSMKTLLIADAPVPELLQEFITRGSTSVDRRRVSDEADGADMPNADRIVFWSVGSDARLRQLASRVREGGTGRAA